MLSSMKALLVRTCVTACVTAVSLTGASATGAAQDQEAGDVRLDAPRHVAEPRVEPVTRTHSARGTPGRLRFYGGFSLAVGGERQVSGPVGRGSDYGYGYGYRNLGPTVGFQGGADYVVMDYFAIGGEMRFLWAKADGYGDRDFLWDLDVKPRGRYVFHNLPIEIYGAMPIGLTVAAVRDDIPLGVGNPRSDVRGRPGFNVGIVAGATWWFTQHIGINAEMGWTFHRYGYQVDDVVAVNGVGLVGASYTAHVKMNQFLLLCPNFVYAL